MIFKTFSNYILRGDCFIIRKLYISNIYRCNVKVSPDVCENPKSLEVNENNLLEQIFKGIVGETKDFFVIDKPASISLFRSKPLENLPYNGHSSTVTVQDILPLLSDKLKLNRDSLYISSELPYQFSGIFIVSKNKEHYLATKQYYEKCSVKQFPGYANQSYRCLCWNKPFKNVAEVAPFSYTYYRPEEQNYQYGITYRVDKIVKKYVGQRKYWTKQIGHELISQEKSDRDSACLIDVECNSTYRGLVQLYLLHQGCIVLGELAQASRLSQSRLAENTFILPPEKADSSKPLPTILRQKLGEYGRNPSAIPLLVHCNRLLVPSTKRTSQADYLSKSPFGFNSNPLLCLKWDNSLKLTVASYYSVPETYANIMKLLGVALPLNEIR